MKSEFEKFKKDQLVVMLDDLVSAIEGNIGHTRSELLDLLEGHGVPRTKDVTWNVSITAHLARSARIPDISQVRDFLDRAIEDWLAHENPCCFNDDTSYDEDFTIGTITQETNA